MDGLELLNGRIPSIQICPFDDFWTWHHRNRCSAIRNGAYDFIEKPFKEERLLMMVERALEVQINVENNELKARMIDVDPRVDWQITGDAWYPPID